MNITPANNSRFAYTAVEKSSYRNNISSFVACGQPSFAGRYDESAARSRYPRGTRARYNKSYRVNLEHTYRKSSKAGRKLLKRLAAAALGCFIAAKAPGAIHDMKVSAPSQTAQLGLDEIKLDVNKFVGYVLQAINTKKTAKEISKISEGKVTVPAASDEITKLKTASNDNKSISIKSSENTDYNPQLKDRHWLSSRMAYINQHINPEWVEYVSLFCDKFGIGSIEDKLTILSQMFQESGLDPTIKSYVGAYGLMQIMPRTVKELNSSYALASNSSISFDHVLDYKDPIDNIELGVAKMAENLRGFKNCKHPTRTALAAYNSGSYAVRTFLTGKARLVVEYNKDKSPIYGPVVNPKRLKLPDGIPPYQETQRYVENIEETKDYILKHFNKLNKDIKEILSID